MTTRGRTIAALAFVMIVFGRLGGMRELLMAGCALALVLLTGFVLVWMRGGRVLVKRRLFPTRTNAGRSVRVELVVEATGRIGMGPVLLADRLPKVMGPTPRLALPGGTRRRQRAVAYTLVPRMRGRYTIGPLEITNTDPFGAVRRRRKISGSSSLLVLPSYEDVSVLPSGAQRIGVVRHSPLVGYGDEFYALRKYEEGDDLRKIHWPTSAKTGELVIRQEELLAEPRALIVLDTADAKHRGTGQEASLEAAISACASVGVHALRRRMRLEIVTPDGPLLQTRRPSEQQFLEALAVLKSSKHIGIARALERSDRPRAGRPGLVVVISPSLRRDDLRAVALRMRGSVPGAIVYVDAPSFEGKRARQRTPPAPRLAAVPVVHLRAGDSFKKAWHTTIKDGPSGAAPRDVALAR
ncbi:MAG: DUF58 domain-containing protein [Actinomycetota bacterium]